MIETAAWFCLQQLFNLSYFFLYKSVVFNFKCETFKTKFFLETHNVRCESVFCRNYKNNFLTQFN